ncbi:phosphoinositide-3-kinase, regulatory subunit 4 [Paragonimus westermani]|uniref:non-specific serine/threonine protein kinase n=1 Tax=Paragonimus westermani TaxID=34504 RepID=A0A5J4NUK4_9TREM|nr:phosphoinositide-3-kinase, regulatory subunit 4 [Paragonimus westermani]
MGNQIAGLTLPPLISVEDCLSDLSSVFRFEEELLGSRLFKVAKAKRVDDGSSQLVVVKVFSCPNGPELMSAYDTLIQAYCRPIASGHNLLSFNVQTSATDRNLLLVRDFIDQSLVDRLCTRPFLCLEEKRWISFQLLHALSQLHLRSKSGLDARSTDRSTGSESSAGVLCHGDIKAENVLLTSWGWVLLSDPAPFKPCWLPADNPSEFTHYFDSSRRRVCYLAPERFVELKNVHPTPSSDNLQKDDTSLVMLPSGRAVYLEQDGVKKAKEDVASTSTQNALPVSSMDVCVDELNLSASDSHQDVLIPEPSSRISKSEDGLEPDDEVVSQVAYMESDDNSTAMKDASDISLSTKSTSNKTGTEVLLVPSMDLFSAGCVLLEMFTDGSVAFTLADLLAYRGGDNGRLAKLLERIPCEHIKSLITSLLSLDGSARGSAEYHLASQKGKAFPVVFYSHLLQYMQTFLDSALRNPTVRVTYIQRFLESSYVHARYPTTVITDGDPTPDTRDLTQTDKSMKTVQPAALETVLDACDAHLSLLRSHIQDRFSDLDRQVRHALMTTDGLAKLAAFFGRSHTSGTLLSHMITFLNDKDDHGLRTSFYRRIVPLITLIGAQSVSVVRPLLEQGLVDPNETVLEVCLRAITQLLNRRLLSAPVAVAFLTRCLSLTAHPTRRLRQGAVAYIAAFARQASEHTPKSLLTGQKWNTSSAHLCSGLCTPASVYARLANAETAKTFFRRPIRECFTSDAVLLTALRPPISRSILDSLVSTLTGASSTQGARNLQHTKRLLDEFLQLLRERETSRAISRSNENPCYTAPNDETVALILAKLRSLGLTELMEAQLIHLFQLVQNLCVSTIDRVSQPARGTLTHTKILLASRSRIIDVQHTGGITQVQSNEKCPIFPEDRFHPSGLSHYVQKLTVALQPAIQRYERLLRRDYFSGRLPLNASHPANGQKLHLFGRGLIWCPTLHVVSSHPEAVDHAENNAVRPVRTITWVQAELNHSTSLPSSLDRRPTTPAWQSDNSLWPSGRPQGTLVAHLHEHRAGLLSLAVHTSGRLMASCSSGDGTVKLWNCGLWPVDSDGYLNQTAIASQRIGGESGTKPASVKPAGLAQIHALPTRSWWTYHTTSPDEPPKPCRSLVWIANGNSLITVSQNRWLHRIDVATGRRCGLEQVSMPDCDRTVCLVASALSQFPDHLNLTRSRLVGGGDTHVVTYATTSNHIVGRDLRIPFKSPPTWCLKQDRGSGLIRSLSMHSCHTWLVTGTSRGQLTIWDLRYERPVACVQHQSQTQAAILGMQVVDVPIKVADASRSRSGRGFHGDENTRSQTLVVAVTDQDNGVTIWDVEACASASSAATTGKNFVSSNITPVTNGGLVATAWTKSGYSPVRSILCCPISLAPVTMSSHFLPSVIAGGPDGRLRYWNFTKASDSKILANAASDFRDPNVTYIERFVNGVRTIYEAPNQNADDGTEKTQNKPSGLLSIQRASSPSTIGSAAISAQSARRREPEPSKSSVFPVEGGLDLCEPAVGHKNVISDISLLRTSQYMLVSASMDGVIKIWR